MSDHEPERAGEVHLLEAAARGDQRAAAVLYDTYADALHAYGLRYLHDGELAEELVQRVLEKLWLRAHTYDPSRGPVRALVFTIARTTAVDMQRQRGRQPEPTARIDGVPSVDDAADQVLLAASVRAALDRLSADHRRILELAYTRGLTQREVAETLDLPLGTVKSRTYYALRALRLACEELGVTR